jgi:hypothetical protein
MQRPLPHVAGDLLFGAGEDNKIAANINLSAFS